jgi:hypothetical protein
MGENEIKWSGDPKERKKQKGRLAAAGQKAVRGKDGDSSRMNFV